MRAHDGPRAEGEAAATPGGHDAVSVRVDENHRGRRPRAPHHAVAADGEERGELDRPRRSDEQCGRRKQRMQREPPHPQQRARL